MWHRRAKRLRDSPSPRRPALFSSASVNAKASKGQCGTDEGKDDRTHLVNPSGIRPNSWECECEEFRGSVALAPETGPGRGRRPSAKKTKDYISEACYM